jgi:hypothetical protein
MELCNVGTVFVGTAFVGIILKMMQTYSPRIQDGTSLVVVVAESKALKSYDSFSIEHLEPNHVRSAILDFSRINS